MSFKFTEKPNKTIISFNKSFRFNLLFISIILFLLGFIFLAQGGKITDYDIELYLLLGLFFLILFIYLHFRHWDLTIDRNLKRIRYGKIIVSIKDIKSFEIEEIESDFETVGFFYYSTKKHKAYDILLHTKYKTTYYLFTGFYKEENAIAFRDEIKKQGFTIKTPKLVF